MLKVSIIIVNYNGKKWLETCIPQVLSQDYPLLEVLIVDNSSTDGSIDYIESNFSKIVLIKNPVNLGFGVANNLGVEKSTGDLLLLLNNDIELPSDFVSELVEFKVKTHSNILGPRVLDFFGNPMYEGKKLTIDIFGYPASGENTFYVEGCALMISKKDFLDLGGFDSDYFFYAEDIDLCWRAQLRGWKISICDHTWVKHFAGGSSVSTNPKKGTRPLVSTFRRYEVEKNTCSNLLKNYSFLFLLLIVPLYFLFLFLELVLYVFTLKTASARVFLRVPFYIIKQLPKILAKRKVVQSQRRVSDFVLLKKMGKYLYKIKYLALFGIPRFVK